MRLIDGDALKEEIDYYIREAGWGETQNEALRWCLEFVDNQPTIEPERKNGKWTEKHHAYSDEESVIEEWQSCRCSECGRYDTRPYMYYFSEPNYCSWCGAKMKGEEHWMVAITRTVPRRKG